MAARKLSRRRSKTTDDALLVDEHGLAPMIGMSVHWLRKDRRGRRVVPFIRVGAAIRYSVPEVQRALLSRMEGGLSSGPSARR